MIHCDRLLCLCRPSDAMCTVLLCRTEWQNGTLLRSSFKATLPAHLATTLMANTLNTSAATPALAGGVYFNPVEATHLVANTSAHLATPLSAHTSNTTSATPAISDGFVPLVAASPLMAKTPVHRATLLMGFTSNTTAASPAKSTSGVFYIHHVAATPSNLVCTPAYGESDTARVCLVCADMCSAYLHMSLFMLASTVYFAPPGCT